MIQCIVINTFEKFSTFLGIKVSTFAPFSKKKRKKEKSFRLLHMKTETTENKENALS